MSFLDLYEHDQNAAVSYAGQHMARDLPADFSDTFHAAWSEAYLFGQSTAGWNARGAALGDYLTEVERATGKKLEINNEGGVDPWVLANEQVKKLKADDPNLQIAPLSDDEIEQRTIAKSRTARTEYAAMAEREKTMGGSLGMLAGGVAGAAADPVNIVAMPVAPAEGLGILATAARWALIGGTSQAAIEALGAPFRNEVQPGYSESAQPAQNVIESMIGAGLLGGATRVLGNAWTRMKTGEWPRSVRDAGNLAESEANIQDTNRFPGVEGEIAHRTALQDSIENLINGRPIDVDREVTPSLLAAYEQRLTPIMDARARAVAASENAISLEREGARLPATMERLSELQLSEIRGTHAGIEAQAEAARADFAKEASSIEAGRAPLAEQQQAVQALRADTEAMRAEVQTARERASTARPATDEATQARLSAIEDELKTPALSSARKADLMAERASITETLAKTAKEDSRAAASLAQEVKGLERGLARQEKALARAEAAAAKAEQKLAGRAAQLPKRQAAAESRFAGQREATSTEMRRTIARLAEEGYGIRLTAEEAQDFADRILASQDDAALRDLTENLVDRAVEMRRAQPELPGFERPVPEVQERAKAGYYTEQMRKGVTALAREVGYEMPRDEAASIAAAITKLPEQEALAVLDEVMLRPRTITESLPGTLQAKMLRDTERPARPIEPETAAAMAQELSPKRLEELRKDPELDETVLRDLDRLRATADIEVPVGETIGPNGERIVQTRKLDDILAEADDRLAAAKEIEACAGPQPAAEDTTAALRALTKALGGNFDESQFAAFAKETEGAGVPKLSGEGSIRKPTSEPALLRQPSQQQPANVGPKFNVHPSTDPEFAKSVSGFYDALPDAVKSRLEASGAEFHVGERLTDMRPDLAGVKPRGWVGESTWESADGLQQGGHVYVSRTVLDRFNGRYVASNRHEGVFNHETGHAFDVALGRRSQEKSFIEAYHNDLANLAGHEAGLEYYLQAGAAGRSEAFAEVFAQLHGVGSQSRSIIGYFPNVARHIMELME